MEKTLYQIFKTFFKVGTLLLGGGYVILPLLQSELVDKKKWIDDDELCEFYALGQSIPGIIAANVSLFVGYKLRKTAGAIVALTGIVLPAFVAIIVLARILEEIIQLKFVQSIFWGVGIGVLMLIFLAVKEIWKKSVVDKFSCWIFFLTFILSACFKAPPASLIILAIFIGVWLQFANKIEHGGKE
jgi:chromate transporter